MIESGFDYLSLHSRRLHGHRYVLPVAVWIWTSQSQTVGASDAMVGLGGRLDRTRAIEALARLVEIGALRELPRAGQRNATRMFERVSDPYWNLVHAYAEAAADPDRAGAG